LQELSDTHSADIALLQGQIINNLSDLNALEAKEISDVQSLTAQLNADLLKKM
jgi:hypothetical protein